MSDLPKLAAVAALLMLFRTADAQLAQVGQRVDSPEGPTPVAMPAVHDAGRMAAPDREVGERASNDEVGREWSERASGSSSSSGGASGTFSDTLASGGTGPLMVVVPAGSFRMGCLNDGGGCYISQRPVHTVNIASFAISRYEVTFEQWDACVDAGGCNGYRPDDRGWGRGNRPVIRLKWNDAQSYVSWLSQQTGRQYRLPSEAEWEYAARAGTETTYDWGDEAGDNRANCDGCGSRWDGTQTAPVGSFAPNPWGLYDVHGNVWEWTQDCKGSSNYTGAPTDGSAWLAEPCSMRILRGGGWDSHPDFCRASYRGSGDVGLGTDVMGLRVVRTLGVVRPDLEVAQPTVGDASPAPGATFTLSATVSNAGDGAAAATTLRYYRSADATVSASDTQVGTDSVGALLPGGTSAESMSATAPSTAGTYYYGACVDAVSGESDSADNCSASVRVDVQDATAQPDLEVGLPTVGDASPAPGAAFTLAATVSNAGDGAAAATTLRYYRSSDATISASDTQVGTDPVGALAAGETSAESMSATAPSTAGTYYYGACVDAVTGESDTTDNCSASVRVDVRAVSVRPDLEVGQPTVGDASPVTGATFTLAATVSNVGNGASAATTLRYYRSSDVTVSTSDTQVGTDPVGALAAGGTSTESMSATAPSTAGTYYYGACVDAVPDESDSADNCSASVRVDVRNADTTAPAVTGASVDGVALVIAFDETLAAAASLANNAFTVEKTPSGGSETTVSLTGSPLISGAAVTLTLAAPVASTDSVTVGYTKPTSGTGNTLEDASGNEVANFADRAVINNTASEATLTARFEDVPDAHDGATAFTLELAFSEEVFDGTESFNRNQRIRSKVSVAGGALSGARRAVRTQNDRWVLKVRPSGDGDVTVTLAADGAACAAGGICTPDGVQLSGEARATVAGPAADAPDAPSAPTLTAGTTWIEASWTAPADNGSAITDYDAEYRESGGNWRDASHAGTSTTKRIEGLAADTAYEVRVRATNAEGTGEWSPAASGRTNVAADAPDAPSAPTLTAGTTWIEASWTAPADNGSAITDYDAEYRESGGNWRDASHAGTSTTKRIEGLAADTAYEVRVRATNAEGTSGWSPAASGSTTAADGAAEGDVRLVNGSNDLEGRVEIYHDGAWGTVCDDRFVSDDAEVVCRQLGHTGGEAHGRAAFGAGTGTIWMDDVRCAGGETRLADCPFAGWGLNNCRHSEDVGVSCGAASEMSLSGATVSGALLTLRYDRPLDGGSVPSPGDFVVAAGASGTEAVPVDSVGVVAGAAVLTLSRAVTETEQVTVSYLPAPMHPLQDGSFNPAPGLTGQLVEYAPVAGGPAAAGLDVILSVAPALPPSLDAWHPAKVEVLDLSARGLTDLSVLSGLTDLEVLDIGGNRIADLWPLAGMEGLERLDLRDNAVADLSALSRLPGLRVLDLSGNAVSDVSPLAALTDLRRLDLSGNRIDDIRPLSELHSLEVLLLDGNAVSNLVPVWGLDELANLGLGGNRVADVALLRDARSLQRLDLSGNLVHDVSALRDLPKLLWLRLAGNPITDFAPLGRLTGVRWLWVEAGTSAGAASSWPSAERMRPMVIDAPDRNGSGP